MRTSTKTRKYKKHKNTNKKGGTTELTNTQRIKKCKNTFMKTKRKRDLEKLKDLKNTLEKNARSKFKNDKTKLTATLKRIKEFTTLDKNFDKVFEKADTRVYCNPNCKETILEPGDKLSERYYKDYKGKKELLKLFEEKRKSVFGKKTNVLVDDFYEKAPKKYIEEIKKDGAISLCSPVTKIIK